MQPVDKSQLAKTIVNSIDYPAAIHHEMCVGGKIYTFEELIDIVANEQNKKIFKIHIPVLLIKIIISIFGWLPIFPIDKDQLKMLLEENVCK